MMNLMVTNTYLHVNTIKTFTLYMLPYLICLSCQFAIQDRRSFGHNPCNTVNLMLQEPPRFCCIRLLCLVHGGDDTWESFGAPVILIG
jgi:hypothetical protein